MVTNNLYSNDKFALQEYWRQQYSQTFVIFLYLISSVYYATLYSTLTKIQQQQQQQCFHVKTNIHK